MARRVFISYQHDDQMKAKGFHLLRWNKNVDLEFVGRHLLDPVKSGDAKYISQKVREQLKGTSISIVLLGKNTAKSDWVAKEIDWSLEKGNGVLGIRVAPGAPVPEQLRQCGAEILDWKPRDFAAAVERAAVAGRVAAALSRSPAAPGCSRRTVSGRSR